MDSARTCVFCFLLFLLHLFKLFLIFSIRISDLAERRRKTLKKGWHKGIGRKNTHKQKIAIIIAYSNYETKEEERNTERHQGYVQTNTDIRTRTRSVAEHRKETKQQKNKCEAFTAAAVATATKTADKRVTELWQFHRVHFRRIK